MSNIAGGPTSISAFQSALNSNLDSGTSTWVWDHANEELAITFSVAAPSVDFGTALTYSYAQIESQGYTYNTTRTSANLVAPYSAGGGTYHSDWTGNSADEHDIVEWN